MMHAQSRCLAWQDSAALLDVHGVGVALAVALRLAHDLGSTSRQHHRMHPSAPVSSGHQRSARWPARRRNTGQNTCAAGVGRAWGGCEIGAWAGRGMGRARTLTSSPSGCDVSTKHTTPLNVPTAKSAGILGCAASATTQLGISIVVSGLLAARAERKRGKKRINKRGWG